MLSDICRPDKKKTSVLVEVSMHQANVILDHMVPLTASMAACIRRSLGSMVLSGYCVKGLPTDVVELDPKHTAIG